MKKVYPGMSVEHLRNGWESGSVLERITTMISDSVSVSECSKCSQFALILRLKISKAKKMDMGCIPGKIIGH